MACLEESVVEKQRFALFGDRRGEIGVRRWVGSSSSQPADEHIRQIPIVFVGLRGAGDYFVAGVDEVVDEGFRGAAGGGGDFGQSRPRRRSFKSRVKPGARAIAMSSVSPSITLRSVAR